MLVCGRAEGEKGMMSMRHGSLVSSSGQERWDLLYSGAIGVTWEQRRFLRHHRRFVCGVNVQMLGDGEMGARSPGKLHTHAPEFVQRPANAHASGSQVETGQL